MTQNNTLIPINFTLKSIIFFTFLEGITVPLVAASNSIFATNIFLTAITGFIVAAFCIFILFKLLKKAIIKHAEHVFGMPIVDFKGLTAICLVAGILLMVMFVVQFILYSHGANDYSAGFFSGLVGVFAALFCYDVLSKIKFFNITITDTMNKSYSLHFKLGDMVLLSSLFGIYELIVCPITGAWIPFITWRIPVAILSGVIGGAIGGLFLYLSTNWIKIKIHLTLKSS